MRTITFGIHPYDDEDRGTGFTVVEHTTLHVVTGDEHHEDELPLWFDTRAEAQAWIDAELASYERA